MRSDQNEFTSDYHENTEFKLDINLTRIRSNQNSEDTILNNE